MVDYVKAVAPAKAAVMCGISRTKFYQLLNKEIPARKIGRRTLILVSDIDRWLKRLPTSMKEQATHQAMPNKKSTAR
jgi:excisionase family DNA binding protein